MNVAESMHECNQHEQCREVDCEVLTINKQSPDIEREINVGNDDFDVDACDTRYSSVSQETRCQQVRKGSD